LNIIITAPDITRRGSYTYNYVVEQAAALQRVGHNVHLLSVRPTQSRVWPSVERAEDGGDSIPMAVATYPLVRGLSYLPALCAMRAALRSLIRTFRPDVVHAHLTLPVGFLAVACGRRLGLPVVITEHSGPVSENFRKFVPRSASRYAFRYASAVIAVSDFLRDELQSHFQFGRRVEVIPNLYDPAIFFYQPKTDNQDSHNILFIGRGGDSRKGNDIMVNAFALAQPRFPTQTFLTLVGPGLQEELGQIVHELRISHLCRFTGTIDHPDIATYIREASFVAVASRYETFCLAIIEALACGRPVVATRCGGPETLLTDREGILVQSDSPEALAAGLVRMACSLDKYSPTHLAAGAETRFRDRIVAERLTACYIRVRQKNISAN
jgi:glycosyltransferase involved in cell wall biosynthesis